MIRVLKQGATVGSEHVLCFADRGNVFLYDFMNRFYQKLERQCGFYDVHVPKTNKNTLFSSPTDRE